MKKMRILTLLATSAALAIAVGGSASAQAVGDVGVETLPVDDSAVGDAVVDVDVVKEDVVIDDGGVIPDEVVVVDDGVIPDEVVVEEVALGGARDLDGVISPEERNLDGVENPDVIFQTMGGGAGDFGGGAADKAAEQAADRALERIDAAAPASARPISTDKN